MGTRTQDVEHLRLLSIFHYVVAGLAALFACIPSLHLFIGIAMVSGWGDFAEQDPMLGAMGWFFIVFASMFILTGWAFACCLAFAGRFLSQRRRYTYCLVMAGVACMFAPFGTVLGVFTIIVLVRDSVKSLFGLDGASVSESEE
jgi:hypothetical protein